MGENTNYQLKDNFSGAKGAAEEGGRQVQPKGVGLQIN